MVYNAQTFAFNYGRDLIIDGFPRTPEQFDWLMLSSLVSNKNNPVEIVYLTVADGVLEDRIRQRREAEEDRYGVALLNERVKKDAAVMSSVYSDIKLAVSENNYSNLTLKEIEL
jgi:adenylate kinase family enzyme